MVHDPSLGFKKVKVAVVVLLTIITLGIYLGYWFISKRRIFAEIDRAKWIPMKLWWVFTVFLCLSFLFNMIGTAFLTPYGNAVFSSFDVIGTFYFLGLLYYSVFRLRDLIEDYYVDVTIKPWLLVLFHVWYLQFKLNRLEGLEHETSQTALAK